MHGNGMRRRNGAPAHMHERIASSVAISHQQRQQPVNRYQIFSLKALASFTLGQPCRMHKSIPDAARIRFTQMTIAEAAEAVRRVIL